MCATTRQLDRDPTARSDPNMHARCMHVTDDNPTEGRYRFQHTPVATFGVVTWRLCKVESKTNQARANNNHMRAYEQPASDTASIRDNTRPSPNHTFGRVHMDQRRLLTGHPTTGRQSVARCTGRFPRIASRAQRWGPGFASTAAMMSQASSYCLRGVVTSTRASRGPSSGTA